MRRLQLFVSLLALMFVAGSACGSDDPSPDAQPAPDVTVFAEGDFGSIPLLPLSDPVSGRNEERGVVTQSFQVRNKSPEQVFDFYRDALEPEWTIVGDPHQLGGSDKPSFRAIWHRDQHRLVVSVGSAGALGDSVPGKSEDPQIQYSLSLEPEGANTFETDPATEGNTEG